MGINKVDQYVKGMFADEAIQPPKGAENALFERDLANVKLGFSVPLPWFVSHTGGVPRCSKILKLPFQIPNK